MSRTNKPTVYPGKPFDIQDFLTTPQDRAGYLEAVAELGDAALLRTALLDVARAQGMADVARRAGLGEKTLFKALGKNGNPTLDTITRVLGALNLRLEIHPAS